MKDAGIGNKLVNEFREKYQQYKPNYKICWIRNEIEADTWINIQSFDAIVLSGEVLIDIFSHTFRNHIKEKKIPVIHVDLTDTLESMVEALQEIIKSKDIKLNQTQEINYENYTFILGSRVIYDHKNNDTIVLTPNEYLVFEKLFKQNGRIVSKIELLNALGKSMHSNENLVEHYISKVRAKLPRLKDQIETMNKEGYRFQPSLGSKLIINTPSV
jgi:DNA-binding winged helix-turn-helix (wHTH) protein